MINCPFTKQVWDFVYSSLKLDVTWHRDFVKEAFTLWSSEAKSWHIIPFFVCRSLWLTRNAFIFEGKTFTPLQVFNKARCFWIERQASKKVNKARILQQPLLDQNVAVGFFDGASQYGGRRCGAGSLLISPELGKFSIIWNCGVGTNSRAELLALWSLLSFASNLGISSLQIVGDSKLIVDWYKGQADFRSLSLMHWMERILHLKSTFSLTTIQHVFREVNTTADRLSKLALEAPVGQFLVAPGEGRTLDSFQLFGIY